MHAPVLIFVVSAGNSKQARCTRSHDREPSTHQHLHLCGHADTLPLAFDRKTASGQMSAQASTDSTWYHSETSP